MAVEPQELETAEESSCVEGRGGSGEEEGAGTEGEGGVIMRRAEVPRFAEDEQGCCGGEHPICDISLA